MATNILIILLFIIPLIVITFIIFFTFRDKEGKSYTANQGVFVFNNEKKSVNSSGFTPYRIQSTSNFIIYSVFSLGIYILYYIYRTQSSIHKVDDQATSPILMLALSLFLFPYINVVTCFRTTSLSRSLNNHKYITESQKLQNTSLIVAIAPYVLLFIFIIPLIISSMQGDSDEFISFLFIITMLIITIATLYTLIKSYINFRKYYEEYFLR